MPFAEASGGLGQPVFRHVLEHVAEEVELIEGRVDVRRDPEPPELIVIDRDDDDLVLVPKIVGHRARLRPHELDVRDGAAHLRIQRRMQPNVRKLHQPLGRENYSQLASRSMIIIGWI